MKKVIGTLFLMPLFSLPSAAETEAETVAAPSEGFAETSEFAASETPGAGFFTEMVNSSVASAMENVSVAPDKVNYSRTLTDYASAPKIGGYVIGKYTYTDQDGKHGGDGFSQRLVRFYLDGSILKDFKYRVQIQAANSSFHMKDFFVEWAKHKEFAVKVGQFKRAFTFENPYNPWDVGTGDYAQMVKKLSGMGDYNGEASMAGGRDQGLQIQGDLFASKADGHRFVHYQLQMMNGQGVNVSDANGKRDFIGTLQLQPVKDLFIGVFGWTGTYTSGNVTVDRNRWGASMKYEHKGWSARAEYAHSQGYKISDYSNNTWKGTGKADGWYATVGVPFNDWCKVYAKYDSYRDQGNWESMKTIYTIAPNFQIHKNLMLQLQYNYVHDRMVADHDYNEIWAETYFRF